MKNKHIVITTILVLFIFLLIIIFINVWRPILIWHYTRCINSGDIETRLEGIEGFLRLKEKKITDVLSEKLESGEDGAKLLIENWENWDNQYINDRSGRTPIHSAAYEGFYDVILLMLYKGADVNGRSLYGNTPLHWACYRGKYKTVVTLIEHGADINIRNAAKETPLHSASSNGQLKVVKALFNANALLDLHDRKGKTPLHNAAEYGHIEIVRLLIDNGAQIDAKDKRGRTPYDWADSIEIRRILERQMNSKIKESPKE